MSFLLSLFSKKLDTASFRATLNSAAKRAQLQRNKTLRDATDAQREILDLFAAGREEKARIRAETMLVLQKMEIAYDIIETLCALLSTRAAYVASLAALPEDLREHVAALLFSEARVDIPELADACRQLRRHFRKDKLFPGHEVLKAGQEPPPDPALVLRLTFLLSTAPPAPEELDAHLANIRALMPQPPGTGGPSRPGGGTGGGGGGGGQGVRIPELPKVGKPLGAAPKAPALDDLLPASQAPQPPLPQPQAAAAPAVEAAAASGASGDADDLMARLNRLRK